MTDEETGRTAATEPDPPGEEDAVEPAEAPAAPPDPAQQARHPDMVALVGRIQSLLADRHRVLVGLAGPPGAGKSAVAEVLMARLRVLGTSAAAVPMEGFHLDQREIVRLGRTERDGAPDTFDVGGYVALLRRLRAADEPVVLAPRFDHELQQPIGAALPVMPVVRVVVTVGDYLLLRSSDLGRPASDAMTMPAWNHVRGLLDTCWFVDTDPVVRRERLVARHLENGRTPDAARARVEDHDEVNARLVAATRARADGFVAWR